MSSKAAREVHRPPADFTTRNIPSTRQYARRWFRLHSVHFNPIHFSDSTANRFAVRPDLELGTLYLGSNPRTCLMEKFGDLVFGARNIGDKPVLSAVTWRDLRLTLIKVPSLLICDLTSDRTRAACGVDIGTLTSQVLARSQSWAKAIMSHPAGFDAIRYSSRFTNNPCLAIYNRRELLVLAETTHPMDQIEEASQFLREFNMALV